MAGHTHSQGPDSSLPIALGITAALLAAACWAMLQRGHGGSAASVPQGLVWPAPAPLDKAMIDTQREGARQAAHKLVKEPAAVALIEAAQTANAHQFTTHPIPALTQAELTALIELRASEAFIIAGPERFLAIGEPVFAACTAELGKMLKALEQGKISWDLASTDPDVQTWSAYRKNCGNILPELKRTKLIDERGVWRDARAPLYVELWQRYRWGFMIQEHRPALLQLSAPEREALLRWRIEDGTSFDTQARLNATLEAEQYLPGYPVELARALILIEADQRPAAIDSLRAAAQRKPHDAKIKRWLELAQRAK